MATVFYSAHDHEGAHRYEVELVGDYDLNDSTWLDSITEQCAEDWHGNYDGWEDSWPRVFTLYASKDSPAIARMSVDREYEPSFSATPA